jgi:16S rRNA (adenine1518-N6/adenine1519-N6)-dimethyltransferase
MVAQRAGGRRSAGGRQTKELGQNFLRDPNILDVIVRASELSAGDVVLEVGGGEGVLTARLAAVAEWVHVVEVDERLREPLERSVADVPGRGNGGEVTGHGNIAGPANVTGRANVTFWWGDAMDVDLAAMLPGPTKLIANLPYGIAATIVLRTIEELPDLDLWLVMVQREVGERLAAAPGTKLYGVSSVLAQLAGEVRILRRIPRTVFRPVPNVDSVLVRIARAGPGASPQVRALVRRAFAHRRKTIAGSLALAGGGSGSGPGAGSVVGRTREQIGQALIALGHPADARAERLAPQEFVALARELGL